MIEKSLNPAPLGIADTTEEPIDVELPMEDMGEDGEEDVTPVTSTSHGDNLAEIIPDDELTKIASELDAEILPTRKVLSCWASRWRTALSRGMARAAWCTR
jgi:hypothetical protein